MIRPALVAMLCLAAVACADDAPSPSATTLTTTIDTVAGVPHVSNRGRAPAWRLAEGPVVGRAAALATEPSPDEFGQVGGVALGPRGRLYVADAFAREIRVFDEDGGHVATWGRQGEGPGEFSGLRNMAWMGDTLLVLDFLNGRVAELDLDGAWLGQRPAPGFVTGAPRLIRLYPVAPGEVVQWTINAAQAGTTTREWVVHRGSSLDTVPVPDRPTPETTTMICDRPDGAISFFERPFGGQPVVHPAPGGATWVGWSADYRLALIGPAGDTLRVVERDWTPLPVSDAEWAGALAEIDVFHDEWPGASCEPRAFERPTSKPAMASIMVDGASRLWVETIVDAGTRWEIFDAEGRLLGSLPGFGHSERTVPWLEESRVAWVVADSLGVHRVHRARILPDG